jgi:molecular chaperone DnaK
VTFDIDSNGIVSAQAKDVTTQREQKIVVTPSSGLSQDEIEAIIEDANENAEEDRRRVEFVRARGRLEGLVDSNQKTFNEFGAMLNPDKQAEARKILDEARRALDSGSASKCTAALERVAQMSKILSEVILYDPGTFSADGATEVDSET